MTFYNRVCQGLVQTSVSYDGDLRAQRAQRLAHMTYEDALEDCLIYGTPDAVTSRLAEWQDRLGFSGVIMEPNVGGQISPDLLDSSIRLFGQEVAPRLQ
ncbi:MAG: hypothetical protein ACE5Q6_02220 [Dehalococcoidia bacterium]